MSKTQPKKECIQKDATPAETSRPECGQEIPVRKYTRLSYDFHFANGSHLNFRVEE